MDLNCCWLQGEYDSLLPISFHQPGKVEQLAALVGKVGQLAVLACKVRQLAALACKEAQLAVSASTQLVLLQSVCCWCLQGASWGCSAMLTLEALTLDDIP